MVWNAAETVHTGHHRCQFHVVFPEGETHMQKWRSATAQIGRYLQEFVLPRLQEYSHDTILHVVEERLGGFTGGLTTKQTLMALAAMNAVVSHSLSCQGEVLHMPPVTTKRIMELTRLSLQGEDKKETVVRLARSSCPDFPYAEKRKPKKESKGKVYPWVQGIDDMADAWLLAEAGVRVMHGIASIGRPEKTRGRKSKARGAKAGRPKEG